MSMIVKNNMSAVRTLNRLNENDRTLAKSLQKVSSGMRINGAADDTSGYSISERMRTRIRGLNQCGDNTGFGRDMLQIAAGAVDQQIQLVKELRAAAMKASDDSYSQADRDILQHEANQKLMQINDISWDTNYNGMRLLDGRTEIIPLTYEVTETITETYDRPVGGTFDPKEPYVRNNVLTNIFPDQDTDNQTRDAKGYAAPSGGRGYEYELDLDAFKLRVPQDFDGQGLTVACTGCATFTTFFFSNDYPMGATMPRFDGPLAGSTRSSAYVVGIRGAISPDDIEQAIVDTVANANSISARRTWGSTGHDPSDLVTNAHDVLIERTEGGVKLSAASTSLLLCEGIKGRYTPSSETVPETYTYTRTRRSGGSPICLPYKDMAIQSDTKASMYTNLRMYNTTLNILFPNGNTDISLEPTDADYPKDDEYSADYAGLSPEAKRAKWRDEVWPYPKSGANASGSCLRTRKGAERFVGDCDQALKYLLHVSTSLGAQMNRMELSNDNIVTANENTTASESTLRDADMAKEMQNYTKSNVLSQTAQSMLSQANQNASSVLDILQ